MKEDFADYYRRMIVSILAVIVERTLRHDPDRMFIDTKFSLITGKDFPGDDPIRGQGTIYPWVQGRGMEALAAHYHWLDRCDAAVPDGREMLQESILPILRNVLANMEELRRRCNGRVFFMMSDSGVPLKVDAQMQTGPLNVTGNEPSNMSELFYVKGLASAAKLLGDDDRFAEACTGYRKIHADIMANLFYNDQQCLDPKNLAVKPVPGRRSHGPKMIAIGAAFRFLELLPERQWVDYGLEYLDYILEKHVNLPGHKRDSRLSDYAFWEFIDDEGRPWIDEEGVVLSDPGHALEFVGLAFKFLTVAKAVFPDAIDAKREEFFRTAFCGILTDNFERAFSPRGFGICKLIDLVSGAPVNSDMPWWNLPETMRAASFAAVNDSPNRESYIGILEKISEAFRNHYVRPDLNMFAYQTLDAEGQPVDVIPGTPDADAAYHTSLSIMDVLDQTSSIRSDSQGS